MDGRDCLIPFALLIGVCVGCNSDGSPGDGAAEQVEKAGSPTGHDSSEARLTVDVDRTKETPVLLVTLENTGTVPLIVDRELVFGLNVEVETEKGEYVRPVEQHAIEPTQPEQRTVMRRFTTIESGQSVARQIDLHGGFKSFVVAMGYGPNGEHSVSAYEAVHCLPADSNGHSVTVTYGSRCQLDDGFHIYVGKGVRDIGLYEGPLERTIQLDE